MKVAMDVTPLLGPGTGVGASTKGLFDALIQRRDMEVVAFALSARGNRNLPQILPATMRRNRAPMPSVILNRLWQRTGHPRVERWIGAVDVVHGTNFVAPPTKAGSLVTVHDLTAIRYPEMCEPNTLRYPALIKASVKRGGHVHTFSQFVSDEVQELLGIKEDRIHVIGPGLDDVETPSKLTRLVPNGKYILAVGTVEPRKNYPMLVRAFDALAAQQSDVTLVIAGARGWAFSELDAAMGAAVHKDRIRYVGRVSVAERNALLSNAIALAYPSIYEGFGIPPLEAMRAGVPVIAAHAGSIPEVVGDAAVLVNSDDEAGWTREMAVLINDGEVQKRLIKAGHAHIQDIDWKRSADKFVQLYRSLAS